MVLDTRDLSFDQSTSSGEEINQKIRGGSFETNDHKCTPPASGTLLLFNGAVGSEERYLLSMPPAGCFGSYLSLSYDPNGKIWPPHPCFHTW